MALRFRVYLALLLWSFALCFCKTLTKAEGCSCESCIHGHPKGHPNVDECPFPFLGLQAMAGSREVTIYGDANARKGLEESSVKAASTQWNETCKQEQHIPFFNIDWEKDRQLVVNHDDPSRIFRTTILINFLPDVKPIPDPQLAGHRRARVASWSGEDNDNRIQIFGKCNTKMDMPCDKVRSLIDWNTPWGSMIIAHEIGHALGIRHDFSNCTQGLMQEDLGYSTYASHHAIIPEYCHLADEINNEKSTCNEPDQTKANPDVCYDHFDNAKCPCYQD
jgi:Metallo-peptidase family M12B Reprolysin-like